MNRRQFMHGSLGAAAAGAAAVPNAAIEAAREAALAILKPSKKELDRGLALHAASVVIEARRGGLTLASPAGLTRP